MELIRSLAGVLILLWPRWAGFGGSRGGRLAGRTLGARQLAQGLILDSPTSRGHGAGAIVDVLHTVSLVLVRAPAPAVAQSIAWTTAEILHAVRRSPDHAP